MSTAILPVSRAMQDLQCYVATEQSDGFAKTLEKSETEIVDFLINPDLGMQATADPLGNTLMHDIFLYRGICWQSFYSFGSRFQMRLNARVYEVLNPMLNCDLIPLVSGYLSSLFSWEIQNEDGQTPFLTAVICSYEEPKRLHALLHALLQDGLAFRISREDVEKSLRILQKQMDAITVEVVKVSQYVQSKSLFKPYRKMKADIDIMYTRFDYLNKCSEILKKMQ